MSLTKARKPKDDKPLVGFALDGLKAESAEHKQWYLEQILGNIFERYGYNNIEEIKEVYGLEWEEGEQP